MSTANKMRQWMLAPEWLAPSEEQWSLIRALTNLLAQVEYDYERGYRFPFEIVKFVGQINRYCGNELHTPPLPPLSHWQYRYPRKRQYHLIINSLCDPHRRLYIDFLIELAIKSEDAARTGWNLSVGMQTALEEVDLAVDCRLPEGEPKPRFPRRLYFGPNLNNSSKPKPPGRIDSER